MKFRQLGYFAGCMLLVALLIMVNPSYNVSFTEVNDELLAQAEEQGLLNVEMPAGAEQVVENGCEVRGVVAGEITFTLKDVAWVYRCAPLGAVTDPLADISATEGDFAVQTEAEVMGCPAVVSVTEGEGGKIIWADPDTGAAYSLVMGDNASAGTLQSIANLMHTPLQ